MSLFIGFVPQHVTADDLTNAFYETFGATVMVRMTKEKLNKNEVRYRSATVDVITSTKELSHFAKEIDEYGSNTFIADKNKYRVQYAMVHENRVPQVKTVKPYVM